MDKASTIAKLNIEHFRRRLATETDPETRETLTRLLTEEEAKLRELERGEDLGLPLAPVGGPDLAN